MRTQGTQGTKGITGTESKAGKRKPAAGKILLLLLVFGAACLLWHQSGIYAFAQGTATVLAESGKIRQTPSTDSTVLASVKKDDTLTVTAQTTDSQGYTWYKVFVNGQSLGYVRADLVNVTGDIPTESAQTAADTASSQTSGEGTGADSNTGSTQVTVGAGNSTDTQTAQEVPVTSSPSTAAAGRTTAAVRVRKGAGTNHDVAGNAQAGTEVSILGESADGSGTLWYQVSFQGGNGTVNGFIRNDYLEITEYVQEAPAEEIPAEGELPQEEVPAQEVPSENNDYYLKYMENSEGTMEWFLFDNIEGTSQSLPELLAAVDQITANEDSEASQLKTMKIVTIVCALIIVALIAVITLLVFKLRDSYYEYEDEEDEEEEEEEEEDVIRTLPPRTAKTKEHPASSETVQREAGTPKSSRKNTEMTERGKSASSEDREVRREEMSTDTNASTWKSKDFLEIDDDMEFEFLDL